MNGWRDAAQTYVVAIVDFIVANEIEFRFRRIRAQNGKFRFETDFFDGFFGRFFIAKHNISIVEWSTAWLRQWHQLAVHVGTEQMENYLEKAIVEWVNLTAEHWRKNGKFTAASVGTCSSQFKSYELLEFHR